MVSCGWLRTMCTGGGTLQGGSGGSGFVRTEERWLEYVFGLGSEVMGFSTLNLEVAETLFALTVRLLCGCWS